MRRRSRRRSRRRCCRSTASRASDTLLGPEMRSTGEVMGIAADFPTAFAKAQAAAGAALPQRGHGVPLGDRQRQGRPRSASRSCSTTSASRSSRPTAPRRRSAAVRRAGRDDQQGQRGLAARGRPDRGGRGRPRHQHADRRRRAHGRRGRSAGPRSPAGSRASRRSSGGLAAARAIRAAREAEAPVRSLQEIHGQTAAPPPAASAAL